MQFTAVPWMRDHLFAEIGRLAETVEPQRLLDDGFKRISEAIRSGGKGGEPARPDGHPRAEGDPRPGDRGDVAARGPRRRGHGRRRPRGDPDGGRHPPPLRRAPHRASAPSTACCASCSALEAKMAQYRDGARFVRAVVDKVGMSEFNAVWAAPENLPSRRPRSTTPTPGSPGSCRADGGPTVSLHPSVAAVRHAVRRGLADLEPGARLVVACSGGADSLALASATVFEGRDQGWYVVGATVDHGLQEGSDARADAVVAQLATLGVDETVAARAHGRGARARPRGGRPGRALRRARAAPRELRRRRRAARPHPRRPGRDRAARPHPRLGRPRARRDAPVLRALPPAAARRLPHRHRHGLPGRGPPGLGRPPQRRPGVHPGPRPPPRAARCSRTSSGPGVTDALARTADQLRPDMELLDAYAEQALLDVGDGLDEGLPVDALVALPSPIRTRVLQARGGRGRRPGRRALPPARRRRRRPAHRLARPEVGRPARPPARRTPGRAAPLRPRPERHAP